jgi:hypothetical protein
MFPGCDAAGFLLRFYTVFAVVAAAALAPALLNTTPPPYPSGLAVAGLVAGHQLAFYLTCPNSKLLDHFTFAAILSVFQVVPDLFLEAVLGTLTFPADGCPMLFGRVSAYMAGMWTIPVLLILYCADSTRIHGAQQLPTCSDCVVAAFAALVLFGSAEELTYPLGLWHATAKVQRTVGRIAVYVLVPEAVLGSAALVGYRLTSHGSLGARATAAASVSLLYTGALAVSFLFTEQLR